MNEPKTLTEAATDAIVGIEEVGVREFFGLEPLPAGRVVDSSKCQCGSGCESFLECEFWYYVRKTKLIERGGRRQVQVGKYRVDCLFDCDGLQVVVELDGKEFHQDKIRDLRRDDELLRTVDAVIRVPYAAMHFYPHATFCVLASWFPRFTLRAIDLFCIPARELAKEIESTVHPDGDFPTTEKYLDWAEPNFEVWQATDTLGFVGSPRAWIKRWNITPISCRRTAPRFRSNHRRVKP